MTTNRLSEEQNREIAEWLGFDKPCVIWESCVVFNGPLNPRCYKENFNRCPNIPSFDSRDGFWLIMDHGPNNKRWFKFTKTKAFVHNSRGSGVLFDYVGPQLAVELARFIDGGIE